MAQRLKIESGLEFYGRIQPRPILQNLDYVLFPNGVSNKDTIEINGNSSNWNSLLLTQLIAKCILPLNHQEKEIGGMNIRVLLLNTNHSFIISKLETIIKNMLSKKEHFDSSQIDDIIKHCLNNLTIINCYSSFQYLLTLKSLDIVINNKKIDLIAIDNINAYYWEDRKSGGRWTMNNYVKNLLASVQKHTHYWNNVFMYSQINYFNKKNHDFSTGVDKATEKKVNHKVKLYYCYKTNKYTCSIEFHEKTYPVEFSIDY